MKDNFNEVYLNIISEAEYDTNDFKKYSEYRNIDIYVNLIHVRERLHDRYKDKSGLSDVILIIKKFIKDLLKENHAISKSFKNSNPEISYTVFGENSKMYISGRFKSNKGVWRCYIATLLPLNDPYIASCDLFRKVKA